MFDDDSDLHPVGYPSGEPTVEAPAEKKPPTKSRKLLGVALLAFGLVAAVFVITSSQQRKSPLKSPKGRSAPVASSPGDPGPLPAVPVLWERLDVGALPADVAQDLQSGKYYYDRRVPGNFGMAIGYWKQALTHLGGAGHDGLQRLVASAEGELARQFSSDSGDAFVMLKQGKRDQAVLLLLKMRADYLDVNSPQYVWASVQLSRRRR